MMEIMPRGIGSVEMTEWTRTPERQCGDGSDAETATTDKAVHYCISARPHRVHTSINDA